ncbi:hypothetical protein OS493_033247 [Desmophyllum pertusum]|uniref:F5/8 type C domain-containing protein n=1 Tax=Desmophyllum pertusum TaxID=174260 RepID=A0A9W9ZWH1_9CNID|nr:hypothetical protein OS493_033247 [Desmophyllum pertusum]
MVSFYLEDVEFNLYFSLFTHAFQEPCVPTKGGEPKLDVTISLGNLSEPIVQGGLVTQHLFITHDRGSRGAASHLVVKWSFPKQLEFDSAQIINGPEYTSLIHQESVLIVKFDQLDSCQHISLAVKFKVDRQKTTPPGKSSKTSTFVTLEYNWEDDCPSGGPKTERTSSSFEYYAPICSSCRPLGMRNGKIKESQLSCSSYMKTEMNKTGNCPHFSRPGSVGVFMVEDGLLQYDRNHFLQVDFRSRTKIEMVSIEGSHDTHVKSFQLHFSDDNIKWMAYKDKTTGKPKKWIRTHASIQKPSELESGTWRTISKFMTWGQKLETNPRLHSETRTWVWYMAYCMVSEVEYESTPPLGDQNLGISANDKSTPVKVSVISPPIISTYLRINPRSWSTRVSMAIELYGCRLVDKRNVPRPLGMESGAIADSQITASSETENGTRDQSRLNAGPEKAWCVQESDHNRTLTIDLQKQYSITQISIQGKICRPDNICEMPPKFVYLAFDGKSFEENGKKKRFQGNQSDHVITHTLIVPQRASKVTIDLSGTQGKRCMRVEVYGKPVEEEESVAIVKRGFLCANDGNRPIVFLCFGEYEQIEGYPRSTCLQTQNEGISSIALDPRLLAILAFDPQSKRLYGVSKRQRLYMESQDAYGQDWHTIMPVKWASIREKPGIKFVQEVPFVPENRFTRQPAPENTDTDITGNIWGVYGWLSQLGSLHMSVYLMPLATQTRRAEEQFLVQLYDIS